MSTECDSAEYLSVAVRTPADLAPTVREWHAMLAQTKRAEPLVDCVDTPCFLWRGSARFRYRQRRWTAARLFYTLTKGVEPPKQPILPACGRNDCVSHVVADRWRPPKKASLKSVFDESSKTIMDSDDRDLNDPTQLTAAERERRGQLVIDEMYAQLGHLERIGATRHRVLDLDDDTVERVAKRARKQDEQAMRYLDGVSDE
jgi:hypothetical protein